MEFYFLGLKILNQLVAEMNQVWHTCICTYVYMYVLPATEMPHHVSYLNAHKNIWFFLIFLSKKEKDYVS